MPRLTLALVALVAALAGGLVTSLLMRPAPLPLDETAIRTIVSGMLAKDKAETPVNQSVAALDPETLNPLIESFLMNDPTILERVSSKLELVKRVAQIEANKAAITEQHAAIYDDPDHIVLGNPNGDVTLVEMFDYNCSYCRSALPDLVTLMAEDPNLRVILKEFPILSQESVAAARVAVVVSQDKSIDYWAFHQALFGTRGKVTAEAALAEAEKLGMNRMAVQLDMAGTKVAGIIQKSYDIAKALNISGTPTYIIGNEMIPGAVGIDELRTRIANMRACGSTTCPDTEPLG